MSLHIIHPLLQGIGKLLDQLRIFFQKALLCRKGRVWYVAGFLSQGSYHISVTFLLQRCCMGFKFHRELCLAAGKGCCRGTKINTLVDLHICAGLQAVLS